MTTTSAGTMGLWAALLIAGTAAAADPQPVVFEVSGELFFLSRQRDAPLFQADFLFHQGGLLRGHGGFEQLEYRDDIPVPAAAAGEVLIGIRAAAVNNTDINTRVGWYSKSSTVGAERADPQDAAWTGSAVHFPRIQGADACGRILYHHAIRGRQL